VCFECCSVLRVLQCVVVENRWHVECVEQWPHGSVTHMKEERPMYKLKSPMHI